MALRIGWLQLVSKPLLVGTLLYYFVTETRRVRSRFRTIAVLAMVFSLAGDILLSFVDRNELFFLLGLTSFLLALLGYILCFHWIRVQHQIEGRWPWAVAVGIYFFFFIDLLTPGLGNLKIPVIIYGMVLCFMLFTALQLYDLDDSQLVRYLIAGSVLFVISDTSLAIQKFYRPVATGGWVVMLTYVAAQYFIIRGLTQYLSEKKA
jgi:uncharacterized membrane protein YhhN